MQYIDNWALERSTVDFVYDSLSESLSATYLATSMSACSPGMANGLQAVLRLPSVLLVLVALQACSFGSLTGSNAGAYSGDQWHKGAGGHTGSAAAGRAFNVKQARLPTMKSSFELWQQEVESWVRSRSLPQRSDADIALNLPFQLKADPAAPYRGRFLLFHGLNDSAYVWRDLAAEIASRGYDVRALLFDGHGTTPEDMLDVHWESWMTAARHHLREWSGDDVPISLGGFSMGAVMATLLAMDNSDIASLLLISPAYDSKLNHYLRFSGIYKLFRPWVFGGMILEDNPMKYNSIPVNSGWQFFELTRELKRRWARRTRIDIPTLMVLSVDDSVVDVDYTAQLFRRRFSHPQRRLIAYEAPAKKVGDALERIESWPRFTDSANAVELSRDPMSLSHRVLNQSHLGIMYSPDNPLFGKEGRVLVCNGNEYPIFMACMRSERHWYGAQHTPSPDGVAVARTTWNPDWSYLLESFDEVNGIDAGKLIQ